MIKKYFLTGLVTLLPLAVTIVAVIFIIHLLTKPFMGIVTQPLSSLPIGSEKLVQWISQSLILITLFLLTLGVGLIAHRFCFKALEKISDKIVSKIPILNKVYKTSKEIFHTLLASDKKSFQQVVLVPFPRKGSYVIGLIAGDAPKICCNDADLISIIIPTTPNPMTSFIIMRPKSDLIYLNMQSEDALKYVVSCGVVPPETAEENGHV